MEDDEYWKPIATEILGKPVRRKEDIVPPTTEDLSDNK
jgi:hypothetical protein